jgi:hypothetical protein
MILSIDCGNILSNGGTNALATSCNSPCTGNAAEICGAGGFLNLYWSGKQPPPPPVTAPSVGLWKSLGCYKYVLVPRGSFRRTHMPTFSSDTAATRSLSIGTAVPGGTANTSVQTCTATCFSLGYSLSGTEFAQECCERQQLLRVHSTDADRYGA